MASRPPKPAIPPAAPEPDPLPAGVVPIAVPLDAVMARVARHALDRPPPVIEPLLTLDGVAGTLAISRRSMERLLSSGGFPPADMRIGRMPRWRPITLRRWIEEQSREGVKR